MSTNLSYDEFSQVIHEDGGLSHGYTLRRHNFEAEANAGCYDARADWEEYVGPVDEFGALNPINGNFAAVCLPLCIPDRLRLCAYVIEYAFIYDNMLETETVRNPVAGRKQLQAKMALELLSIDEPCGNLLLNEWKAMVERTRQDKNKSFDSLEEHVDFRIVDTGAIFTETLMLFGMSLTLTEEERKEISAVVYPCHACLGLANDYFSFDREYAEFDPTGNRKLINAVWLFMNWHGVDAATAKQMVVEATIRYEEDFLRRWAKWRTTRKSFSQNLDKYLEGLSYMVSGNIQWSLNCPRYNPESRYDINSAARSEGYDRRASTVSTSGSSIFSHDSSANFSEEESLPSSPKSSTISESSLLQKSVLNLQCVRAPYEYTSCLPSKGSRDIFADSLNNWIFVPDTMLNKIKKIISELHNASLMLDDIEDGSNLRRGKPTAHTIFGIAQTMNSANEVINRATIEAKSLGSDAVFTVLDELEQLYIGQGHDLNWTFTDTCPSEEEYLDMVAKKTGGLFHMLARLMLNCGSYPNGTTNELETFVERVGIYYQIRDDYQNLKSDEYETQKGFCEDLDEGKFSFPIIHHLKHGSIDSPVRESLRRSRKGDSLSVLEKRRILECLEHSGSLQYTRDILRKIQHQIESYVDDIEAGTSCKNWTMRYFLRKLWV